MADYIVHSRHETEVPVPAKTADGVDVIGQKPVVIIELIPNGWEGRSITIEQSNGDAAGFEVGATVEAHFTIKEAK